MKKLSRKPIRTGSTKLTESSLSRFINVVNWCSSKSRRTIRLSSSYYSSHHNDLPQCDKLMQNPSSPFADGAFLTRKTTQVVWKMRHDGSRELTLPQTCQLKRYTAHQARRCLTDKSMLFIGDSLTRYQYFSLVYFLEYKKWPPRYPATGFDPCFQADKHNNTVCSKPNEPNVCCEYDGMFNPR
jgi:hypothetical protein